MEHCRTRSQQKAGNQTTAMVVNPSTMPVVVKNHLMPSARIGDATQHQVGGVSGNLQIGFTFSATNDLYNGGCRFRVRTSILVLVGLCKQLE